MCGIAGYHRVPALQRAGLKGMADAIRHRGPDGEGLWTHPGTHTGLGHRRLAILDLSADADQPFRRPEQERWIVFNGEIYNFLELRKELEGKGYAFRTRTDTEVVLAAYDAWGERCFDRFNGMWALAIFDAAKGRLLLSRDRFGIKPLYYSRQPGNGVIFASELKSFLALKGAIPVELDRRGWATALISPGSLEAANHTLLEGVKSLGAGELLTVEGDQWAVKPWWNTADHLSDPPQGLEAQAERFRELFFDACRLRLRSDVPVATSLSGGLDSSSIVSVVASMGRTPGFDDYKNLQYKTFAHEFPGSPLDERKYVEAVARKYGIDPVWVRADASALPALMDRLILQFESVYPGIPDSPWRLYKAQRDHGITVTLDGHGADEYLGGYHDYTYAALVDGLAKPWGLPGLVKQIRAQTGAFFSWSDALKKMVRTAADRGGDHALMRSLRRLSSPAYRTLSPRVLDETYEYEPLPIPHSFDAVNRGLYADFHQRVLPRILKNFDLMSMAHGVEVRMPFMDYRLVTFGFSLPSSSKIGRGVTKLVLREAMKDLLPEEILNRKLKIGFNSPFRELMGGPLRPWIEETLSRPSPMDEFISRKTLAETYRKTMVNPGAPWSAYGQLWKLISATRLSQLWSGLP